MKFSAKWLLGGKEVDLPEMNGYYMLEMAKFQKLHSKEIAEVKRKASQVALWMEKKRLTELPVGGEVSENDKHLLDTLKKAYSIDSIEEIRKKVIDESALVGRISEEAEFEYGEVILRLTMMGIYSKIMTFAHDYNLAQKEINGAPLALPFCSFDEFIPFVSQEMLDSVKELNTPKGEEVSPLSPPKSQ